LGARQHRTAPTLEFGPDYGLAIARKVMQIERGALRNARPGNRRFGKAGRECRSRF